MPFQSRAWSVAPPPPSPDCALGSLLMMSTHGPNTLVPLSLSLSALDGNFVT